MFTSKKRARRELRKLWELETRNYLLIYVFSDLGSSRNEWKKKIVYNLSKDGCNWQKKNFISVFFFFSSWVSKKVETTIEVMYGKDNYAIHNERLVGRLCCAYQTFLRIFRVHFVTVWRFENISKFTFSRIEPRFPPQILETCMLSAYLIGKFALSSRP